MTLASYETVVKPEWIDYNGHFSEGYYVLVFGFATDQAMDALGLGTEYRTRTGCSLFTVEAHIRYLQEVGSGAPLTVTTQIIGVADKKLHLAHWMRSGDDLIATEEILGLHIDQRQGHTVALPSQVQQAAQSQLSAAPDWSGRRTGI